MSFLLPFAALAATTLAADVVVTNPGNIFVFDYDGAQFNEALSSTVEGMPSWGAFAGADRFYAVDEYGTKTSVYNLDLSSSSIELISQSEGSSGVVHLEFNKEETRMVGAGYGAGTIDIWNTEGGSLQLIKTINPYEGVDPDGALAAASHPHQSVLDPTGRFFIVNDLGTGNLLIIDSKDDLFEVVKHVDAGSDCGPRHSGFYPPGAAEATHYLLACEFSNVVLVFSLEYTMDIILPTLEQTISTLGGAGETSTTAAAGELVIAGPEDVYVSNRLTGEATDNIAHFKVVAAGGNGTGITLEFAGKTSTGGTLPRMFSLGLDGKDLLVANQAGPLSILALRRGDDGSLDETPVASIESSYFGSGTQDSGPQYVKQVQ